MTIRYLVQKVEQINFAHFRTNLPVPSPLEKGWDEVLKALILKKKGIVDNLVPKADSHLISYIPSPRKNIRFLPTKNQAPIIAVSKQIETQLGILHSTRMISDTLFKILPTTTAQTMLIL